MKGSGSSRARAVRRIHRILRRRRLQRRSVGIRHFQRNDGDRQVKLRCLPDHHDDEHDQHHSSADDDAAARSDQHDSAAVNNHHDDDHHDHTAANHNSQAPADRNKLEQHNQHDASADHQHDSSARSDDDNAAAHHHDDEHHHDHHDPGADDDAKAAAVNHGGRAANDHNSTMNTPRVSVALAALNEGAQLEATVACIRASSTVPDEIVVYDDCGAFPARPMDGVKLIRGTSRIGSGPAKHAAIAACAGDLVIVMDGHCRPAIDWLDHLVDEHRRHPWAVMCTTCVGIEGASFRNGAHRGCGGRLEYSSHVGFWEVKWAEIKPGIHSYNTPTVVGGCYAIPREVLSLIGGYAPAYFGYGVEEEYLGIRAWLVGAECRYVPRSVVGHWFNRTFTRATADGQPDRPWEQHYNRHVCALVCFEDGVYERVYKPRLAKYGEDPEMMSKLEQSKAEIEAARALVQRNRKFNDAALLDWAGLQHPTGA